MNAPAAKRMTVPEFLAWAETQDRPRFELVHGQIVAMSPERLEHSRAKLRAARALDAAVQRAGVNCEAFVDGPSVAIDNDTCYEPDALVSCGERGADDSMVAPNPVIVVEVLSPATRDIDKTVKLADYFRVPGLSHYLIVDLSRRHIVHYRRQPDGVVTVAILKGGDAAFETPGISVAVTSFFE
jgi:Uma2 family endonuclease